MPLDGIGEAVLSAVAVPRPRGNVARKPQPLQNGQLAHFALLPRFTGAVGEYRGALLSRARDSPHAALIGPRGAAQRRNTASPGRGHARTPGGSLTPRGTVPTLADRATRPFFVCPHLLHSCTDRAQVGKAQLYTERHLIAVRLD